MQHHEVSPAHTHRWKFSPTLSFDGVAIIGMCVGCAVWFGSLSETVKNNTEAIRHHDQVLQTLSEGQKLQAENIAVLQAILNERTKNGYGKP